jgi:hypothetical protein
VTQCRGTVISVHQLGATVRLEDGRLAAIPAADVAVHRPTYLQALTSRAPLTFVPAAASPGSPRGRHIGLRLAESAAGTQQRADDAGVCGEVEPNDAPSADSEEIVVPLAPTVRLHDEAFEERMARYLKSTEEWAPPDAMPPAERHFLRKKRRAAYFEARAKGT